ncbi:hypothetical protein K435DRAFT_439500 [Dendrothele bispora CBS 962.96]|uniref:Uncharacterized protein n=1 Tax=Dendrothele bispora (strain CBS 962.96) TaxID=1314807 RepID=A0A4S8L329_DENBC|nr:hypothetical protein K435DRAFT_439500 [Dendrothele bispora CBS 962.96]
MHPTVRVLSARVHNPLIRFLGKRSWPSTPETPHSHPFVPAELRERNFADFAKEIKSSGSSKQSGSKNVFNEFWEAPQHLWNPRIHELEEAEIEAIMVCSPCFLNNACIQIV